MYSVVRLLHQGWKKNDGRELAAPFSPSQLTSSPLSPPFPLHRLSRENFWLEAPVAGIPAPMYLAGASTSSLDLAHALVASEALPEWGSVIVHTQSSGRGQLRRNWVSPPGNVYAALRLPLQGVFTSEAASLGIGALLADGLDAAGYPVHLKWPNDLLQYGSAPDGSAWRKVGGILLEERGGALIAGIGINLTSAPPPALLREEHAFPAGRLCRTGIFSDTQGPAEECLAQVFTLWRLLVERIFFCYKQRIYPSRTLPGTGTWWFDAVNAHLAFRCQPVRLVNAQRASGGGKADLVEGFLEGIDKDGALCLVTDQGREKFIGGSLVPVHEADSKG